MEADIVSGVWQPVPGTSTVQLYPFLVRTSITSSNCYLLSAPAVIVVIDPGANPQQTAAISHVVSAALAELKRPVVVLLTHCHQDHSQEAANLTLPEGTQSVLCLHTVGVAALESADRELTFCCYYPWETQICQVSSPLRLFSGAPLPTIAEASGLSLGADPVPLPSGELFEREWLALGNGERLDIYYTPGHSDCSVTLTVGDLVFLGDLPFAVNPGMCGIYGWDHAKLLRSIRDVTWLLNSRSQSVCLLGHGWAITSAAMLANLDVMAATSSQLTDVSTMSLERIAVLKLHLDEILEEASYLCTVISGQLYALSFMLSSLEENAASESTLAALDAEQIEQNLADLRRFILDFTATRLPDLTLILKGVQVIGRLLLLIDERALTGLIEPSLLARARGQFEDFLSIARGLHFLSADAISDLNVVVNAYYRRLMHDRLAEPSDQQMEDGEDATTFTQALVRQLAGSAILHEIELELDLTSASTAANLGGVRVGHILESLVEAMVAAGQTRLQLRTQRDHNEVVLRLSSVHSINHAYLETPRLDFYRRTIHWLGGRLLDHPGHWFEFRLPACQDLRVHG